MQDIIKEIAKIDTLAFNAKEKSQEVLQAKRNEYEVQMEQYEKQTLDKAEEKAKGIYNQIVENGKSESLLQEEKAKKMALSIKNKYMEIETKLLDEAFHELFMMEG